MWTDLHHHSEKGGLFSGKINPKYVMKSLWWCDKSNSSSNIPSQLNRKVLDTKLSIYLSSH